MYFVKQNFKMMLRIVVILFLLLPASMKAQEKYKSLLKIYNRKLDSVGLLLRMRNETTALDVISQNNGIYQKLIELDTIAAKPLFIENVRTLDIFLDLLKSDTTTDQVLSFSIKSLKQNADWYNQELTNPGLESCPQCFLIRKVRVTVLRRVNDQKLDTMKCALVDYRKVLLNNTILNNDQLTSFPCPEYERTLSTGPKYYFIVSQNGKKEVFEKSVNIGNALTDIQDISLVLPRQ